MYDEVHVDGGCCAQVFLLPQGLSWEVVKEKLAVRGRPSVWVIRNARLEPDWKTLELSLATLAARSIDSLIRTQGLGDIYRIWVDTRENDMDFHLAHMPEDFDLVAREPFDREYMNALFDKAYRLAKGGYPWEDAPPDEEKRTTPPGE